MRIQHHDTYLDAGFATQTIREGAEGSWKINQLKGPQNQFVSLEVELAAFAIIRAVEDSSGRHAGAAAGCSQAGVRINGGGPQQGTRHRVTVPWAAGS